MAVSAPASRPEQQRAENNRKAAEGQDPGARGNVHQHGLGLDPERSRDPGEGGDHDEDVDREDPGDAVSAFPVCPRLARVITASVMMPMAPAAQA